jgi:hypothetical protein
MKWHLLATGSVGRPASRRDNDLPTERGVPAAPTVIELIITRLSDVCRLGYCTTVELRVTQMVL